MNSMDITLSPDELEKGTTEPTSLQHHYRHYRQAGSLMRQLQLLLSIGRSYILKLDEPAVIYPHEGHADVEVTLFNNESMDSLVYSGLQVDSVDLKPFTESTETKSKH